MRIANIILLGLTLFFGSNCLAQNHTDSSKAVGSKITLQQIFPDTISVLSVSDPSQEKPWWQSNFQAIATLAIGLIALIINTIIALIILSKTLKRNLEIMREQTQSQFLQNNTRVWVHDIIDSITTFLAEVTLLSTDSRYNGTLMYQLPLSGFLKGYIPMSENQRIELSKQIDARLSKLRLLLYNETDDADKIIKKLQFLFSDAHSVEVCMLSPELQGAFHVTKEEVLILAQNLLTEYRKKTLDGVLPRVK